MFKRPRLALAALSFFLCLHLWGAPIVAVPMEGALAISEDPRATSVIIDVDESRKVLKPLDESVYAGPGRKTLHPVPRGLPDVAQPTSLDPEAPRRRFRDGQSPTAHGRKRVSNKLRKISGKSREVLRPSTQSRNSLHDPMNAWAKAGNNSLESTSVMGKGGRYRKLRYGKKGTGSSSRSKKLQAMTMANSNGTRVPDNVSQPKDQEPEALQVKAPESAPASPGHALASHTPTPKDEPIATLQEPAMRQFVEPVTTQPSKLAAEMHGELPAAENSSEPMTMSPGEPLTPQSSEPVTTHLSGPTAMELDDPVTADNTSEPVPMEPSGPTAKNSGESAMTQTSEPAAMKPVELAAKNPTAPVTTQPIAPAAAEDSATAHSGGPPGAPLNNTANATDSGPGGKGRKINLHILVPMLE